MATGVLSARIERFRNAAPKPREDRELVARAEFWWLNGATAMAKALQQSDNQGTGVDDPAKDTASPKSSPSTKSGEQCRDGAPKKIPGPTYRLGPGAQRQLEMPASPSRSPSPARRSSPQRLSELPDVRVAEAQLSQGGADAVLQLADRHPRLYQALRRLERSSDNRLSPGTLAKVRAAMRQAGLEAAQEGSTDSALTAAAPHKTPILEAAELIHELSFRPQDAISGAETIVCGLDTSCSIPDACPEAGILQGPSLHSPVLSEQDGADHDDAFDFHPSHEQQSAQPPGHESQPPDSPEQGLSQPAQTAEPSIAMLRAAFQDTSSSDDDSSEQQDHAAPECLDAEPVDLDSDMGADSDPSELNTAAGNSTHQGHAEPFQGHQATQMTSEVLGRHQAPIWQPLSLHQVSRPSSAPHSTPLRAQGAQPASRPSTAGPGQSHQKVTSHTGDHAEPWQLDRGHHQPTAQPSDGYPCLAAPATGQNHPVEALQQPAGTCNIAADSSDHAAALKRPHAEADGPAHITGAEAVRDQAGYLVRAAPTDGDTHKRDGQLRMQSALVSSATKPAPAAQPGACNVAANAGSSDPVPESDNSSAVPHADEASTAAAHSCPQTSLLTADVHTATLQKTVPYAAPDQHRPPSPPDSGPAQPTDVPGQHGVAHAAQKHSILPAQRQGSPSTPQPASIQFLQAPPELSDTRPVPPASVPSSQDTGRSLEQHDKPEPQPLAEGIADMGPQLMTMLAAIKARLDIMSAGFPVVSATLTDTDLVRSADSPPAQLPVQQPNATCSRPHATQATQPPLMTPDGSCNAQDPGQEGGGADSWPGSANPARQAAQAQKPSSPVPLTAAVGKVPVKDEPACRAELLSPKDAAEVVHAARVVTRKLDQALQQFMLRIDDPLATLSSASSPSSEDELQPVPDSSKSLLRGPNKQAHHLEKHRASKPVSHSRQRTTGPAGKQVSQLAEARPGQWQDNPAFEQPACARPGMQSVPKLSVPALPTSACQPARQLQPGAAQAPSMYQLTDLRQPQQMPPPPASAPARRLSDTSAAPQSRREHLLYKPSSRQRPSQDFGPKNAVVAPQDSLDLTAPSHQPVAAVRSQPADGATASCSKLDPEVASQCIAGVRLQPAALSRQQSGSRQAAAARSAELQRTESMYRKLQQQLHSMQSRKEDQPALSITPESRLHKMTPRQSDAGRPNPGPRVSDQHGPGSLMHIEAGAWGGLSAQTEEELPLTADSSLDSWAGDVAASCAAVRTRMLVLPLPDIEDDDAVGIWEGCWIRP